MIEPFTHSKTVSPVKIIETGRCKICRAPARYSYYGVISCQSCKMFFKRNAESRKGQLRCHFSNQCDIDVNNRHTCSACRLEKCFIHGMRTELIRCGHGRKKGRNGKKNLPDLVTSTILVPLNNRNQPEQIPSLNLLRSDQSTLSIDQWNLLSNLVHCYDEYSGYSFVKHYIHNQNALPAKLRFKCSSVKDFFTVVKSKIQQGFEKNRDLLSLSSHDRTILLRATVQYTSGIGGMFTLRQHQLFNDHSFYESAETIFRPRAAIVTRRIIDQLDPDDTFIKLMFAIIAASTIKCTIYTKSDVTNLTDINAILSIQNTYVELAWRYALYKYGHYHTVIRFSNLIRCLLFVNDVMVEANESQQFIKMIDTVTAQVEQDLCL